MAFSVPFGDPIEAEQWAKDTEHEVLTGILGGMLVSSGADAICKVKTELAKAEGLNLTVVYQPLVSVPSTKGRTSTEQNLHEIQYGNDTVAVNLEEFAFDSEVILTDQQILQDFREDMKHQATQSWIEWLDKSYLNQLAGYTLAQGGADGNNTITAPSTGRQVFGGTATSDATLVAGDNLDLDLLRSVVEKAETFRQEDGSPSIVPGSTPVGQGYALLASKRGFLHLMNQATSTVGQLLDIQKAAMQGGEIDKNIIRTRYKNAKYQYHGMIDSVHIFTSPNIPRGISGSAPLPLVDRNTFCGAQSACVAYGKYSGGGKFRWVEETIDFERRLGVTARMMHGFKKFTPTIDGVPVDVGTIVISTHRSLT